MWHGLARGFLAGDSFWWAQGSLELPSASPPPPPHPLAAFWKKFQLRGHLGNLGGGWGGCRGGVGAQDEGCQAGWGPRAAGAAHCPPEAWPGGLGGAWDGSAGGARRTSEAPPEPAGPSPAPPAGAPPRVAPVSVVVAASVSPPVDRDVFWLQLPRLIRVLCLALLPGALLPGSTFSRTLHTASDHRAGGVTGGRLGLRRQLALGGWGGG